MTTDTEKNAPAPTSKHAVLPDTTTSGFLVIFSELNNEVCKLIAEYSLHGYEVRSMAANAFFVFDPLGVSRASDDAAELQALASEVGVVV